MHIRKIRIKIGWKKKGVFWFIKRVKMERRIGWRKKREGESVGEGKEEEGRRAKEEGDQLATKDPVDLDSGN
ncbi:hypothetical protein Syun_026594 [Stephania yunnanensis]|uniref:Uncharacterized protein n=1 Tax=Stephania yunnanensis TaxID=152371 RepID=A0AAP0F2R3_9MAGN